MWRCEGCWVCAAGGDSDGVIRNCARGCTFINVRAQAREREMAYKKCLFFSPCYIYNPAGLLSTEGSGEYSLFLPWCLIHRTSCGYCHKGHHVRKVGLQWNKLIFHQLPRTNVRTNYHQIIIRSWSDESCVEYSPRVQSLAWFLHGIFLNGSREVHPIWLRLFSNRRWSATLSGRLVVTRNTVYCVQQTQACVWVANWNRPTVRVPIWSQVAALSSSLTFKLPDLKVDH